MKIKTLTVVVNWQPRENESGYTSSDYARDAAADINKRLGDQGYASWPSGDEQSEQYAIRLAEQEIAEVTGIGRELLKIEVEESEIYEEEA